MSKSLLFKFDKRYPLLLRYILEKRGAFREMKLRGRQLTSIPPLLPSSCVQTLHTHFNVLRMIYCSGWSSTAGDGYDLWWRNTRFPPGKVFTAKSHQRINHFINSGRITKKAGMIYYMKQYRRAYGPQVYNFMPPSLIISPRTDKKLIQLDTDISKRIWIVKPSSSSQGRGIRLIDDLNTLDLGKYYSDWREAADVGSSDPLRKPRTFVVSQYIDNPYLIRGYKHDIRLYVLVTSYHPLEVRLYREGLVRFATKPYVVDDDRVTGPRHETVYRHLTNTSINKFNPMFKNKSGDVEANEMKEFEQAMFSTLGYGDLGKRTLRQLFSYFHRQGIDYQPIWDEIKKIVLLTLLPLCHLVPKTRVKCFELYGFDILLDAKLKPWLIEVNFSPSLALETVTDQSIKESLLDDVVDTLGFDGLHPGGTSRNKTIFPWEDRDALGVDFSGNFEKIFPVNDAQSHLARELSDIVTTGPEIIVDDEGVDDETVAESQELPPSTLPEASPVFDEKLAEVERLIVDSIVNPAK
jgi:tubulin polyglutamylase TTLL2